MLRDFFLSALSMSDISYCFFTAFRLEWGSVLSIRGNTVTDFLPIPATTSTQTRQTGTKPVMTAAKQLEAGFLAEMLKSAGFGEQENGFSGSTGEDQFASFHRQAIADRMVENGGIGLAEMFYKSLMEKAHD